MSPPHLDAMFARFSRTGDPEALAFVFERTAPGLARKARRMLGCSRAAEDVVQDLFLSLLAGSKGYDSARPCRPFLIGALHRHASRWRRGMARQAAGPLPDGALSHDRPPDDDVRASEFIAAVRSAMGTLPVSSREVVRRYLELHETPQEIGRALRRRAGTVRVQLHRGLRELRSRLPQGFFAVALLLLARPVSAAPPSVPLPVRPRWLLAGAAAITVAIGVHQLTPAAVVIAAPLSASSHEGVLAAKVDVLPASVRVVQPQPEVQGARLRLQFADGSPAKGIGVVACLPGRDPDFAGVGLRSDAAGVVVLDRWSPGALQISTDRGTKSVVSLSAGANPETVITLPRGSTVRGRVVDERGEPVTGADLWVCHEPRHPWSGQVVAHSDEQGAFELRDLPAMTTFAALSPGRVPSPQQVAGPRERSGVVLRLGGKAASVTGIVLGPDGAPLAGAAVRAARHARSRFTLPGGSQFVELLPELDLATDAEGRFTCSGLPDGRVEVSVRASSCASALVALRLQPGEAKQLEVRLRAGCNLRGSVRDPAGRPVPEAQVVAHGRAQHEWSGVDVAEDGSFLLSGVATERTVHEVSAPGFATRELPIKACAAETLDLVLQPLPALRGRFEDASGGSIDVAAWELGCREQEPEARGAGSPDAVKLDPAGCFTTTAAATAHFFCRRVGSAVWLPCATAGRSEDELILRVPRDADAECAITVRLCGFTERQFEDAMVLLVRDLEVYRCTRSAEDRPGEVTVAVPVGEYEVYVYGQQGLCPPCTAGVVAATSSTATVSVTAPATGQLRYDLGKGVERCHGFFVDEQGQQVPLLQPRGSLTLGAGRWQLWASSLSFMTVRGMPFEVRVGEATVLDVQPRQGLTRHVAFTLPHGVDAGTACLRLWCRGAIVLGDEPGLRECGFDIFADGFCRAAIVLADDDYQLELRDGARCFRSSFTVSGEAGVVDPVLVALGGG